MFYSKINKLKARRRLAFVHDVRSAVWADKKEIADIVEALSKVEDS